MKTLNGVYNLQQYGLEYLTLTGTLHHNPRTS